MGNFDVIHFSQYDSDSPDDDLLLFAAPAAEIWDWAGIPRQGWNVRMLYQRWVSPKREQEVAGFWKRASTPDEDAPKRFILGPTALTVAIFGDPEVRDGRIALNYVPPFGPTDQADEVLRKCARVVLDRMRVRLDAAESEFLQHFENDPWVSQGADSDSHNFVLEGLCQIAQMADDPERFVGNHALGEAVRNELIQSLESLCRPALVVDGQHRLHGAAHAGNRIWLPVVAIPRSPWVEQIYQFVLINDKAQKVSSDLLTDIFGSSLTPSEQARIRRQLDKSGVDVEARIAAVIASKDGESPFQGMVRFNLPGQPAGESGFIPELTIRQLIGDDSRRRTGGGRPWRTDDSFYEMVVAPAFPDRMEWEAWTDGAWRDYWNAFWTEVRDFYNVKASEGPLWGGTQTNLTKAVTLRLFQRLYMETAIEAVEVVEKSRQIVADAIGDEAADQKLGESLARFQLPSDLDEFRKQIRTNFLEGGVPVRVFEKPWVSSLDDSQGQEDLYRELREAYELSRDGKPYRARNKNVFAIDDA